MPPQKQDFSTQEDYALMAGIAGGSEPALGALYDRYAAAVMSLCVRVLRDRALAEEVVEDVFFEIWSRAARYGAERSSPRSYLMMLARSRSLDKLRSEKKHKTAATAPDAVEKKSKKGKAAGDPVATAETKEEREKIIQALGRLSTAQRQAVETSFFEGLSHREIAEKLGQPLGTVKTHLRQGFIRLRGLLRTLDVDGGGL